MDKAPWERDYSETSSVDTSLAPWEREFERPKAQPKQQDLYIPDMAMAGEDSYTPPTQDELLGKQAGNIEQNVETGFSKFSDLGNLALGKLGNVEAEQKAREGYGALRNKVLAELKANGIQGEYTEDGELVVVNENGEAVPADSSLVRSLWQSKWGIAGSIGGAITGARVGMAAGAVAGPYGVAVGGLVGGVVGGAAGTFAGTGLDSVLVNMDLVNKASDDEILSKMKDAGVADAMLAPLGLLGAKMVVGSGRAIKRAYDFILAGNKDGARAELKKYFKVTDSQIDETIAKVESLQGTLPGTQFEKGIISLAITRPKGEDIVSAAGIFNPNVSSEISYQVSKRADDLLNESSKLATDNNLAIFKDNMDRYVNEVKSNYDKVKSAPEEFTGNYSFDFEKLGIEPIIDDIGARIENPALKQRFVNVLTRIEQASEGRTFNDLIDLRQAVNDIKYNTPSMKFSDKQALESTLKSIDNEIDLAAKTHIPKSDVWLDTWNKVKTDYAKMKDIEENVMVKALSRPGITEDAAVKVFSKYIAAGDNTFYNVMEKLTPNVQKRIEGSVLNALVEKYTVGTVGGTRAVHFPQLSQELKKVSWKAGNNAQLVRTINRMAEVFKNDVNLVRATKGIEIPKFQSYLTVDPIARAKYEIASHGFNYVKQLVPGDTSNTLALLKHTSRILDNPLNSKSINEMKRALPKDKRVVIGTLDVDTPLREIQQAYVERQAALKQLFGKDAPPRLVWHADPEKLAKIQNPTSTTLPSGQGLYATQRGTVGVNPSEITLAERSDDLVTEFIWKNSQAKNDLIVEKATQYMDDKRYMNIMKLASSKLVRDDIEGNAKIVANSIRAEAGILRKRIEKDFGLKMPKDEAEKLVWLKYKEVMENCNDK